MKQILSPLILCCAMALAAPVHAQLKAPPQPVLYPGPASAEQLAAASRLLQAMEIPRVVRYALANRPTDSQEGNEVNQHMSQHVTDAEICEVMAPPYAKFLSANDADRLAIHMRTSMGRRQVDAMLASLGIIKGSPTPFFTPGEIRELRAFDALPMSRVFAAAQPQIQAENKAAMTAWRTRYYQNITRQALLNLREISEAAINQKPGEPAQAPAIKRTGLATLDKAIYIIAENNLAVGKASRAMNNDLRSYGLDQALSKERLVSAEGIALSKKALASSEERVERYLSDMDTQQNTYRAQLTAAITDKQSLAAFEPSIAHLYDQLVRFGENQRALFDVFTRVINFSESRLGTMHVVDQRLLFDADADVKVFNTLMEQVDQLARQESELIADGRKRVDDALNGKFPKTK